MDTERIQSDSTATANQVVAANIRRCRKRRGWTQDEFAERLEKVLGERWSIAVVSAAERSVTGKRVREFTADELVALARTFEVPISSLFEPCDAVLRVPDQDGGLSPQEWSALLGPHRPNPIARPALSPMTKQVHKSTNPHEVHPGCLCSCPLCSPREFNSRGEALEFAEQWYYVVTDRIRELERAKA